MPEINLGLVANLLEKIRYNTGVARGSLTTQGTKAPDPVVNWFSRNNYKNATAAFNGGGWTTSSLSPVGAGPAYPEINFQQPSYTAATTGLTEQEKIIAQNLDTDIERASKVMDTSRPVIPLDEPNAGGRIIPSRQKWTLDYSTVFESIARIAVTPTGCDTFNGDLNPTSLELAEMSASSGTAPSLFVFNYGGSYLVNEAIECIGSTKPPSNPCYVLSYCYPSSPTSNACIPQPGCEGVTEFCFYWCAEQGTSAVSCRNTLVVCRTVQYYPPQPFNLEDWPIPEYPPDPSFANRPGILVNPDKEQYDSFYSPTVFPETVTVTNVTEYGLEVVFNSNIEQLVSVASTYPGAAYSSGTLILETEPVEGEETITTINMRISLSSDSGLVFTTLGGSFSIPFSEVSSDTEYSILVTGDTVNIQLDGQTIETYQDLNMLTDPNRTYIPGGGVSSPKVAAISSYSILELISP